MHCGIFLLKEKQNRFAEQQKTRDFFEQGVLVEGYVSFSSRDAGWRIAGSSSMWVWPQLVFGGSLPHPPLQLEDHLPNPLPSPPSPSLFPAPSWLFLQGSGLVAHDCGYPLSRYTWRATRVAADFLDFIAFCRCSTGVALHPLKI